MRLALILLLALCLPLFSEIVQIGGGTLTNQSLPLEPARNFSYSQQVYYATEINTSGMICSVGFQYSVNGSLFYQNNCALKVFLGHTDRSQFEGFAPLDSLNLVYDGILALADFSGGLPGQGWLTINLQTPFLYNGTDNLLVVVDENSPGCSLTSDEFLGSTSAVVKGIVFTDMNINPDPADPPQTGFYSRTSAPNLRLDITFVSNTPYAPVPEDESSGVSHTPILQWQSDAGSFDLYLGTEQTNLNLMASGLAQTQWNVTQTLQPLQAYYWQVIGHDGGEDYPGPVWSFTTLGDPIGPPQNLSGYFNTDHVQLSWQPPQTGTASYYRVFRNNQFFATCTGLSYQDYEISEGLTYYYHVKAVNALGEISEASNTVSVHVPGSIPDLILLQGFEECAPFSAVIPGWQNIDYDGSLTWTWDGIDFPHEGEALAWLSFFPAQTIPPLNYVFTHSGTGMLVAMDSLTPANDDWLISPRINLGEQPTLTFYARSHTADFGLERLRVLISTTDTAPSSFTAINSCGYIQVPAEWTEYSYNLMTWKEQSVYLAWQCLSWDAFALYLDEIIITGQNGYVPLQEEVQAPALPRAYPNPTSGAFSIGNPNKAPFDLELFDLRGRLLLAEKGIVSFHSAERGLELPSGVYLLRFRVAGKTHTQRISLIK